MQVASLTSVSGCFSIHGTFTVFSFSKKKSHNDDDALNSKTKRDGAKIGF